MDEYPEYCDNCGTNRGELIHIETLDGGEWSCMYCYHASNRSDHIVKAVCSMMNLLESRITERIKE